MGQYIHHYKDKFSFNVAKNHQTLEAFEYRGKMFIYKYIIQMDQQRIVYSMLTVGTLVISSSLSMKSVVEEF